MRMRLLSGLLLFILIIVWSAIALAAMTQANAQAAPTWFEHVDLMQAVIAGLFLMVIWFCIRTLKKIDANQTALFQKYDDHETRLSHLEGAHATRTGMKLSCTAQSGE